jgi:uroporphyrinogen III methyltransferase / synthase
MSDEYFLPKPLANRTILLACSAKKMAELAAGIEAMGGNALLFPVIEVQDVEDKQSLDNALASLNEYAWIIFSSAYGVKFFVQRLKRLGIRMAGENMPKICAIGPATAKEIHESGYDVELVPEKFVADGVLEALTKYHGSLEALAGRRVLIPRAKEAREVIPEALAAAGILVDAVPCYQTVRAEPVQASIEQLKNQHPDMIVFTSSSTIKSFVEILGKREGIKALMESTVAVLGPITADTAESYGKSPDVLPRENTIASLLEAIHEYYSRRRKNA